MIRSQKDTIQEALDKLALALTDREHTWTPEERRAYEVATGLLSR